jgi:hypothetical protein
MEDFRNIFGRNSIMIKKHYWQQLIKFMLKFGFSTKRQTFNKPICYNGKISDFPVAQIL